MNTWRMGLLSGILAAAIIAGLKFVSTSLPGRDLHGVAGWFALDGSSGSFIGFILLLLLGCIFGLLFGIVQQRSSATLPRMLALGLLIGLVFWLIVPVLIGTFVGHQSVLTVGSFLSSFVLSLVFGELIGVIYFQNSLRARA